MAGWRSELAGCRSTLSLSKIKVKISDSKFLSFYKTLRELGYESHKVFKNHSANYPLETIVPHVTIVDAIVSI